MKGRQGRRARHTRDDPKGQATTCLSMCVCIYIFVVKIQKCQGHLSQGEAEELPQTGGD